MLTLEEAAKTSILTRGSRGEEGEAGNKTTNRVLFVNWHVEATKGQTGRTFPDDLWILSARSGWCVAWKVENHGTVWPRGFLSCITDAFKSQRCRREIPTLSRDVDLISLQCNQTDIKQYQHKYAFFLLCHNPNILTRGLESFQHYDVNVVVIRKRTEPRLSRNTEIWWEDDYFHLPSSNSSKLQIFT